MTNTAKPAKLATVKGSGNVFADLGRRDAKLRRLKAQLAAEIIRTLNDRDLTVRQAEALTGTAAADFSRLKGANLGCFTVDRLMTILRKLDCEVMVKAYVMGRKTAVSDAAAE